VDYLPKSGGTVIVTTNKEDLPHEGPEHAKVVHVDGFTVDEAQKFIRRNFEMHPNLKYNESDVANLLFFLRNGNTLDVIRPIHAERACRAIPYHGSVSVFLEKMKEYDSILHLFGLNDEETWLAKIMKDERKHLHSIGPLFEVGLPLQLSSVEILLLILCNFGSTDIPEEYVQSLFYKVLEKSNNETNLANLYDQAMKLLIDTSIISPPHDKKVSMHYLDQKVLRALIYRDLILEKKKQSENWLSRWQSWFKSNFMFGQNETILDKQALLIDELSKTYFHNEDFKKRYTYCPKFR
jgi:hypothetical protein